MNLFGVLDISASGLQAERVRAEVVASNMANAQTTRTPEGGPYRRKMVVFGTRNANFQSHMASLGGDDGFPGVAVEKVLTDPTPAIRRFEPSHPDADAQGYVSYPDIDPIQEMTDLMGAARAYELNASAIQVTKSMIQQSLEIVR